MYTYVHISKWVNTTFIEMVHFQRSELNSHKIIPITYPLIIAKDSSLEKKELPGILVTVSLPALIRSGSTSPCKGNGP